MTEYKGNCIAWLRSIVSALSTRSRTPWRSKAAFDNLEAWAMLQGYDPLKDYLAPLEVDELPEGYLSKNFHEDEFRCQGLGTLPLQGMDPALIDALQALRDHYGVPMTINSGYRSPEHNAAVGGAPNSQHVKGTAVDFVVKGVSPAQVYALLDPVWEGGLGKYNTFTHIDTRAGRARWTG
jgi:hypothetical protein